QGHHCPTGTGAGGTSRTVQVGLVLGGRIHVHHQVHVVDVDTAGGDVRGHQDAHSPRGESLEVPLARVLGQVAVQVHGRHALGGQLPGELLRLVFGAGEQQAASLPCCQTAHQYLFGRDVRQVEDVVGHGRDRRLGGVHRVLQGLVQVTLD